MAYREIKTSRYMGGGIIRHTHRTEYYKGYQDYRKEWLKKQMTEQKQKDENKTFSDYLNDLKSVYTEAATKRAAIKSEFHKKHDEDMRIFNFPRNDYEKQAAQVRMLDAEKDYKDAIETLRDSTGNAVQKIREGFSKCVQDRYFPSGAKIDDNTVKLLNSGISLSGDEIAKIAEDNKDNPTMLRIISGYCDRNGISNSAAKLWEIQAKSGGSKEMELFDALVDNVMTAAGGSDAAAEVWGIQGGFFENQYNKTVAAINNDPAASPEYGKEIANQVLNKIIEERGQSDDNE